MRLHLALTCVVCLAATTCSSSSLTSGSSSLDRGVSVYDPDPAHPWNQLHATFFVREDLPSTKLVPDALDPPLWYDSQYLLAKPSHQRALRALDDFVRTHAENRIHDPLKRAMLQRDLWAVFDWSVKRPSRQGANEHAYDKEKQELQVRLAKVMRLVALTPKEIRSLPNNYEQAVASGEFTVKYDPAQPDRTFLPSDLFDPHGPWVELEGPGDPEPVARSHFSEFSGRSSFLVFVRLPEGRKAAFDYLYTLWNFPKPTIPSPHFAPGEEVAPNPDLPQFPPGTQFALVRQMTLFDNLGRLVNTPITESVQIRMYSAIAGPGAPLIEPHSYDDIAVRSGQRFYEIALSRPQLFSNKAGGLRATGRDEKQYLVFGFPGPDHGIPARYPSLEGSTPVLKECVVCHSTKGIHSVNSRNRLLPPNQLQVDRPHDSDGHVWWQDARTIPWKQRQDDWNLLIQDWKAAASAR
jgi:hypothetical protein